MRYWFCVLIVGLAVSATSAQPSEFVKKVSSLIVSRNFSEAEKLTDAQLKTNPSPDAWMMKGNILLNYTWLNSNHHYMDMAMAENPTDTGLATLNRITIIPADTSKLIENCFKKAIALDTFRTDLVLGLCHLYSLSLRTKELIKTLDQLHSRYRYDSNKAYIFAEYARNLRDRGAFDDAVSVYKWIAAAYPDEAGIRADLAGEFFYRGRPVEALQYIDSALKKQTIDEITMINCAGMYSMLGYFDDAQKTYSHYGRQYGNLMGTFYAALVAYSKNKPEGTDSLKAFIHRANPERYADEVDLATRIAEAANHFALEELTALAADVTPPYYRMLILQKGMNHTNDTLRCESYLTAALHFGGLRMWNVALDYLENDDCSFWYDHRQTLQKGFLELQIKDYSNCISTLQPLTEGNGWVADAARYLSAKAYLEQKKNSQAVSLLQKILPSGENKYQVLKSLLMQSLK